jgi:superfamily II DNA or RNA helicase
MTPSDPQLLRALALLWAFRPLTAIHHLLGNLRYQRADGRPYTQNDIRTGLNEMRARGEVETRGGGDSGYFRLTDPLRARVYRELLDDIPASKLRAALYTNENYSPGRAFGYWPMYDTAATAAIVRLALFTRTPAAELRLMTEAISRNMSWDDVIAEAALAGFDPDLFERIDPAWRWDLYYLAAQHVAAHWHSGYMPLIDHAFKLLDRQGNEMPPHLHLQLAEILMLQGQPERARALLDGLQGGSASGLAACLTIQAGQWAAGQAQFEAAIKLRQTELGAKKRVFPESIAWLFPLALLAQGSPAHLQRAQKFCLNEAGKRKPDPYEPWGFWAHAISVRLGEVASEAAAFAPTYANGKPGLSELWRLLLSAWLGRRQQTVPSNSRENLTDYTQMIALLRERLQACRMSWLETQLDGAVAVLNGANPPPGFFMAAPTEVWRDVLAALRALDEGDGSQKAATEKLRLIWTLSINRSGEPESIEPQEQKYGVRGWNRPRPISLGKLAANTALPAWDAKVAAAILPDRNFSGRYTLDRALAIMALVGHPHVCLAEAPDQFVELVEGQPEVEVVQQDERFVMKVTPPLRPGLEREETYYITADERREIESLRAITVLQDAPQRLRVIRLTQAQRKAAQLLANGFAIPAQGRDELDKTLATLAAHFQVQADHAEAAREVPPETKLRAELSPAGDDLILRLVAAPLGVDGPRLIPARGRERVMALHGLETVGTRRDIEAERAHLDSVLEALPFLDPLSDEFCEWQITDPDDALGMVEHLPQIAAIVAVDWPKGKPVRVLTIDAAHLGITVKSERDWFRLSGTATVDEGLVLQLADLVAAAQSKSRFVPMGNGVYAALTRSLKQRLAEMATLAEVDKHGMRLPGLAGGWLDEAIEGMAVETDAAFRQSIDRLRDAQAITPILPATLQAELRPYQEDGFVWAMRLAHAGLGACLADDMGLGKTLQALGVLLARAAGGPALVLAPTSVCGNWLAEAQRFAPTLDVHIYGEADRDTLLAGAAPGQVVLASYTLFQQAQERFAALRWHTVIADEAQAIKNASAKRSQAVFELEADFRMALSGTPVENRLADLWSIMRFAAPGLLGTQSRFAERFATPIERNRDRDAQHLLRRLIAPFILRRTKAQVLEELPPRTELIYSVAPDAVETAHYEALRRNAVAVANQALDAAPGQAKLNILAQLTRLRRGACDPRLPTPDYPAPGAKVQAFAQLATELASNGHKALVFSQFVDFLTLLKAPLDAAGIRYQYLDGSTPAAERTRRVAAFQAGTGDLFLISLKAGGFGLNLTAADYVVITDPWWNPAAEDQAMGRAHRIGQLRPVTVYRMVTKGTVEERIVELHHDKRALAESVLAEGEVTALPSTDDLMALIRGE